MVEPRGARYGDRVVGLVALAVVAVFFARTFAFRIVDWDPLGLAFWPRVVLALIAVCALIFVVRGSVAPEDIEPIRPGAFGVLAGCALYVLGLPLLGFALATPTFVALFAYALGRGQRHRLGLAVVLALATTGAVYLLFQVGLEVQLPRGELLG